MFTVFQNLLPRALAWRTTVATQLRQYVEGLANWAGEIRTFIDLVYLDLFPTSTRELPQWEDQFALVSSGTEAIRRARFGAAWQAQGGQSPDYIETQMQLAGFGVWLYEWWESGPPYVARDPRDFTTQPLIGFYQCEDDASAEWECFDPGPGDPIAPHCDDSLGNDPGYIVNLDLTRRAPPPVPDDPDYWPYFLYIAGPVFPELAYVDGTRLDELKEKILQLRPTQQWIVLMVQPFPLMASLLYRFTLDSLTEYETGTEDDLRRVEVAPNNLGIEGGDSVQAVSASRPTATSLPEGRVAYFSGTQALTSDLAAAVWNRLHSAAGVATVAIRFRPLDDVTDHQLINTSGATKTDPGFDLTFEAGAVPTLTIGRGGGLSTVLTGGSWGLGTFTAVIVKNGLDVDFYFEDMSVAADSTTLAAASSADAASPLTLGGVVGADGWIAEVLIYDMAATEEQRDEIAAHLAQWEIEPTQAEYIAHMVDDGLAHYFDGNDVAADASTWEDTVTETDLLVSTNLGGGSRTKTTLDGHASLRITNYQAFFNAATTIAIGTNKSFTVVTYAGIAAGDGLELWRFFRNVSADTHFWNTLATTTQISRQGATGGAETSTPITTDTDDRFYSHVFRAANDGANLVRAEAVENNPALNVATVNFNQFFLRANSIAFNYGWLVMFDRALSEGDLRALYQVIQREL